MNKEQFISEIKKLNIEVTDLKLEMLDQYYKLLVEWNEKINLTSIIEEEEVYLKHFYDSLTLVKVINLTEEESLCDVGTGAGFPGIVLKIFFPHLKLTLVDSLNKRIKFLDSVVNTLNLENVVLKHERAEELSSRETFDIVTARAVAPLNILLEYCIPLVKVDKYFIAMKGNLEEVTREIFELLDCRVLQTEKFVLPLENSTRTLIKVLKEKETDKKYPRRYSEIKKKPL